MSDQFTQFLQLVIAGGADLLCCCVQGGQAVAIFNQVLLPAQQVYISQQNLDFATDQEGFKGGVVNVHIGDVELFNFFLMSFNARQHAFHIAQLSLHGQGKRRHGAFHAFEHVDTQQVNQAFFTICLAEEALAATNLGAVLLVIGFLLVRQHIAQGRIRRKVEPSDFQIDVADGAEFARTVHIGFDVDGRQALREPASLCRTVILFNMAARACDGQVVQQGKVVKAQHFHQ